MMRSKEECLKEDGEAKKIEELLSKSKESK